MLVSISNLFQGIAFSLFVHFSGFLAELGAGSVAIGWVYALTALAGVAVRPAIGAAMDRRGRRRVILTGNLLNVVVVSLFVNPRQFSEDADLSAYPRDLARDARLAENAGADVLFAPAGEEVYPEPPLTTVSVSCS